MNQEFDLTPYQLERTEKVQWRFPYHGGELIDYIKSKGLKSFLQSCDVLLAEQGISVEYKSLDENGFAEWLQYYQSNMAEHGFDQLASMDWYHNRTEKGRNIEGIFFYQQGKLMGTAIVSYEGSEKATLAFKASERIDLSNKRNSSLGAVVDYYFLKHATEQHIPVISSGRSRNAFGVINNFGYLDYKLRFGYEPSLANSNEKLTTVPLNEQGCVLCYATSPTQPLALYAIMPKDVTLSPESAHFATPEIPFIEIKY